jgi:hypothetical protein
MGSIINDTYTNANQRDLHLCQSFVNVTQWIFWKFNPFRYNSKVRGSNFKFRLTLLFPLKSIYLECVYCAQFGCVVKSVLFQRIFLLICKIFTSPSSSFSVFQCSMAYKRQNYKTSLLCSSFFTKYSRKTNLFFSRMKTLLSLI